MLSIQETTGSSDCSGVTRRDFLKVGAWGFGGLSLPSCLAAEAQTGSTAQQAYRGKSVVILFLSGGASHIETFDPKMDAPVEFRSVTGSIASAVPGVHFGSTYREMARRADKLAVVRSFAPHQISDHARAIKHLLTAGSEQDTSIGSRFARFRGTSAPQTGMPSYCTLIENNEPDSQYQEDRQRMRIGSAAGDLGQAYAPFDPGVGGKLAESMELRLPVSRLNHRRQLLKSLDRFRRLADGDGSLQSLDSYRQQAFDVILGGGVQKALDLSSEDPKVLQRYDTSGFQVGWTRKRKSTLGHRMLLARRLIQAGCGFVTVGSAGWDNHANGKHPNVFDGMNLLGRPLDQAVGAFLDDLDRLGMTDDVLLIITSEFGRTPKIGKKGGREHWPGLGPLVLAGGGIETGQVIGESTSQAERPKTEPLGYPELLGTIWHTLFDLGQLRLDPSLPRGLLSDLEGLRPIPQLMS